MFSLPAIESCPAPHLSCLERVLRGSAAGFILRCRAYQALPGAASKEDGFTARMIGEIRRRRWAGWCPHPCERRFLFLRVRPWCGSPSRHGLARRRAFFAYTRSWQAVADMAEAARRVVESAAATCASGTRATGIPAFRPAFPSRVKLAWMQTKRRRLPAPRRSCLPACSPAPKTVASRVALTMVCPVENGATGTRTDRGALPIVHQLTIPSRPRPCCRGLLSPRRFPP